MHNITSHFLEDPSVDSDLVADLINNNFVYKINSNSDKEEVEMFYEDIGQIVEQVLKSKASIKNTHVSRKRSTMIRSSFIKLNLNNLNDIENLDAKHLKMGNNNGERRSLQNFNTFSDGQLRASFSKLKEKLQYRYCIFRIKCLDERFYADEYGYTNTNFKFFGFNYDSDEDIQNSENNDNNYDDKNENSDENNFINLAGKFNNQSKRNKSKLNTINNSNLFESNRIKLNQEEIRNLVKEFERYFSLANENEDNFSHLKQIAAHIKQAGLLFEINNESEGIRQCIIAMEKTKKMQLKINKFGNLSKFAYLVISNLFFEKILYLISTISEKYDQKKTQFYIHLNMLDLGPVYDKKIRAKILQKTLDYLNKLAFDYINGKSNRSPNLEEVIKEDGFINSKLVRHKVRALLNMSKPLPKNILLLLDLNLPFLKENNFQKILMESIEKNEHFFYFACFDHKLQIYRNNEIYEEILNNNNSFRNDSFNNENNNKFINENFYLNQNINDQEVINIIDKSEEEIAENNSVEEECNNFEEFFDFINSYKKVDNLFIKNLPHRVDFSIKNSLKFYNFKEYPKNNNFLIVITTIDAGFSFHRENILQISESLYESQYSIIICILSDERMYSEEKYKNKLECYKKFIENDVINGHLFILKSFSLLKYVINSVSPSRMKEFDLITMKTFLDSIDLNFCVNDEEVDSKENGDENRSSYDD